MSIIALIYGFIGGRLLRRSLGGAHDFFYWLLLARKPLATEQQTQETGHVGTEQAHGATEPIEPQNAAVRPKKPTDAGQDRTRSRDQWIAFALNFLDLAAVLGTLLIFYSWIKSGQRPYFFYHEFRLIIAYHAFFIAFYVGLRLEEFPGILKTAQKNLRFNDTNSTRPRTAASSDGKGSSIQGALATTALILLAFLIFVAPMLPGIENLISRVHLGDLELDFGKVTNRDQQISLMQYKADKSAYGKKWLFQFADANSDFFKKRAIWYTVQFNDPKIAKKKKIGIEATKNIFADRIAPYLNCLRIYSSQYAWDEAVSAGGIAELSQHLYGLAFFVNENIKNRKDFLSDDDADLYSALYAELLRQNVFDPDMYMNWRAKDLLAKFTESQNKIYQKLNKQNVIMPDDVVDDFKKCDSAKPIGETEVKDIFNAYLVSYMATFTAELVYYVSNANGEQNGLRLLDSIQNAAALFDSEINYQNYRIVRLGVIPGAYDDVLDQARTLGATIDKIYQVSTAGSRSAAFGGDAWSALETQCLDVKYYEENSDKCAKADSVYFLRLALNSSIDAVIANVLAEYTANKRNLAAFFDANARTAFRQLSGLFYGDNLKEVDLTTAIFNGSLSAYGENLRSRGTEKQQRSFWQASANIALFHVLRLIADDRHKDNLPLVLAAIDASTKVYADYINLLTTGKKTEKKKMVLELENTELADIREAQARRVVLIELSEQLRR